MTKELSEEDIARMQKIHSDFVTQTKADPSLAQDLLDATDWNIAAALEAYKGLSVTYTEQSKCEGSGYTERSMTILYTVMVIEVSFPVW